MSKREWLKHLGFTTATAIATSKITPMSTEELLRPRYKVIAQYPFSPHPIGHIIKTAFGNKYFDQYPHLFKKLEWYEERNIDEMPEYVKVVHEGCAKDTGLYCKVHKWHVYPDKWPYIKGQMGAEIEGYCPDYLARTELNFPGQIYGRLNEAHLQPATLAEYEQYINQKEKQ